MYKDKSAVMYLKGVGVIKGAVEHHWATIPAGMQQPGRKFQADGGPAKRPKGGHDLFLAHQHQHARGYRGATPTSVVYVSKMLYLKISQRRVMLLLLNEKKATYE